MKEIVQIFLIDLNIQKTTRSGVVFALVAQNRTEAVYKEVQQRVRKYIKSKIYSIEDVLSDKEQHEK